jgi:hypothetical protein
MLSQRERFAEPLTGRKVVLYVVGAAIVLGVAYLAREYLYPWLGLRIVGFSGLAPFFGIWSAVALLMFRISAFRKSELLFALVSIPVALALTLLVLLTLAPYLHT